MTIGVALAVLVGVLALATVLGLVLRRRTGRARAPQRRQALLVRMT